MTLLIFLVGSLLGVLAGGALCVHSLRSAVAADIGPKLQRMHADIDPKLRGMQNQLDLIESALNYALATRYAEMSSTRSLPQSSYLGRNDEGPPQAGVAPADGVR